jgi:hypothetical protein
MVLDLGKVALGGLHERLAFEAVFEHSDNDVRWSLGSTAQRAASRPGAGDRGYPCWNVQVRTPALAGFSGTPAQGEALSTRIPLPTIACLAQSSDEPARLDLVSSLEVHRGNVSWVPDVLASVARIQAVEARALSALKGFDRVGLKGLAEPHVDNPYWLATLTSAHAEAWPDSEIGECIDVLVRRARAEIIPMPARMSTSLLLDAAKGQPCILQINPDATHASLGQGLQAVLNVPIGSGPLRAIIANALEVGPHGIGDALGGWWATSGGIFRYVGFYPNAMYRKGLALQLLLGYAERAHKTSLRWLVGGDPRKE